MTTTIYQLGVWGAGRSWMSPSGFDAAGVTFATRAEAEIARGVIAADRADGDAALRAAIEAEIEIREIDA